MMGCVANRYISVNQQIDELVGADVYAEPKDKPMHPGHNALVLARLIQDCKAADHWAIGSMSCELVSYQCDSIYRSAS
jgi:hypothetical protein